MRQALLEELEQPFQRERCEAVLAQINRTEWPKPEWCRLLRGLLGQANSMPQPSAKLDPLFNKLLEATYDVLMQLLSWADLDSERENAIVAAEVYVNLAGDVRTGVLELVTCLMAQADFLRDHRPTGYETMLAIALRTVASIASYDVAPYMTDFLRPRDASVIKQCGLMAIRTFFSGPSPPEEYYMLIWLRLSELLQIYMQDEIVHTSTEMCALAISTFVAAAASGMPRLLEHAFRIDFLPPLVRDHQLLPDLRKLRDHWQECRRAEDSALTNLTRLLERLV